MELTLREHWTIVHATTNSTEIFLGPFHKVDNPAIFPSVSQVINESSNITGIRVKHGHEGPFDAAWLQEMKKSFAQKSAAAKEQLDNYMMTGFSNGRRLGLQIMLLPPGRYFKIHAHPNIEFECTLKGSLHEFRWTFVVPPEELQGDNPTGPEIAATQMFHHLQVSHGECLVNEIGTVHQSFTPNSNETCAILVLWSGCHANTPPSLVKNTDCRLRPQVD